MADLKLDNEFGSALAGAGSKPAFANLVRFRAKEATQEEFPTTLILTWVQFPQYLFSLLMLGTNIVW